MATLSAEEPLQLLSARNAPDLGTVNNETSMDNSVEIQTSTAETFPTEVIDDTTLSTFQTQEVLTTHEETSFKLQILRQAACYFAFFLAGYNGGVTGTLLPTIEKIYKLDYSGASLLFVAYCVGYLASALGTGEALRRLGFGKVFVFSGLFELSGIIINCSQLVSFPLMCLSFFIVGLGYSNQLGICNSYFATLRRPLLRMGVLHGIYGFGAFTSPIIASQFISRQIPINYFYLTSLALCIPTILLAYVAFVHGTARFDSIPEEQIISNEAPRRTTMKEIISSFEVWTLALFLLFYVGAEESVGGWIVSYMLKVRHGNEQGAAWVASGFYLGIAVGRITLPVLNTLIGERKVVLFYILIACGLQVISWAVKSFIGTAIATALVGYVISTFYTAAIHMASKLLPRRMHPRAMSFISSIGQSGSALFPLIIGVISDKKGIWVVQPSIVALLIGQFVCWSAVPKVTRRLE